MITALTPTGNHRLRPSSGSQDDESPQLPPCAHADLRRVRIRLQNGVVHLHGRVGSFHAKQWAQVVAGESFRHWRIESSIVVDC